MSVSEKVAEGLLSIADGAFAGSPGPAALVIPKTVDIIGYDAFSDCENLAEVTFLNPATDLSEAYSAFDGCADGLTFIGPEGSTAEAYAEENGIPFSVPEVPDEVEELAPARKERPGSVSPVTVP